MRYQIKHLLQFNKNRGFTLIELMITVAIIAILAAIALPSYESQIIKSNRAVAKSEMMDIANRQQQYFLANRQYATATELGYNLPNTLSGRYTATITPTNPSSGRPTFLITFTATGKQASDGALTLNSEGVKTPSEKW